MTFIVIERDTLLFSSSRIAVETEKTPPVSMLDFILTTFSIVRARNKITNQYFRESHPGARAVICKE